MASSTPNTNRKNREIPEEDANMGSNLKEGRWQMAKAAAILLEVATRRNDPNFCIVSGFAAPALRPWVDCA
jgi:urease accessory protein UreF